MGGFSQMVKSLFYKGFQILKNRKSPAKRDPSDKLLHSKNHFFDSP